MAKSGLDVSQSGVRRSLVRICVALCLLGALLYAYFRSLPSIEVRLRVKHGVQDSLPGQLSLSLLSVFVYYKHIV